MKCFNVAISIAPALVLSVATAFAAEGNPWQSTSVQPTAYDYGDYYAQEEQGASPSDRPAPATATANNGACDCQCDPCDCYGCGLNCPDENPWRLFPCHNECGWELHGWVNGGITGNTGNPASRFNGPMTFNDRMDGQLNQAYLTFGKVVDTGGCGWDVGGRIDALYGTDSRFTEARGLEKNRDLSPHWNSDRFYGLAMPQAYVDVGYNDWLVRAGHFYTITGYETVTATGNFFYSHSYTHQYGEPFHHTGVLATYKANDEWSVSGGVDRGWDNWEDDNFDEPSFLGGITWNNGEGLSIALAGTVGEEPVFGANLNGPNTDRWLYTFVLSWELDDRWTYVFQHDNGFQNDGDVHNGGDAEWYGINQYLYYKLNCCWSLGGRFEWFRDDDGVRVAAVGDRLTPNSNPASLGGFVGDFFNVTVGLNWKPNDNLVIRPEVRYDWFDGANVANGGIPAGIQPYDDLTDDKMFTYAIDAILKF